MTYFGGSSGMVGDPGFFDTLFGGVGRVAKAVFGATPVGLAGAAVGRAFSKRSSFQPPGRGRVPQIAQIRKVPGVVGAAQRFVPGGQTGLELVSRRTHNKDGSPRRIRKDGMPWKIPTMDVANPKALRRAIRRQDRFVSLARGALRNSGFKVVSKSAGKMTQAAFEAKQHHRRS